jgi:peptidoglycan/xylan/chitin deacetylase (PgdA/CDA1 family)
MTHDVACSSSLLSPLSPIPPFLHNLPRLAAPLLPGVVARGPAHDADGAPRLYLTFDDGPGDDHAALLDGLARHDARATFFFLGERAERRPEFVRAAAAAGHGVGAHGWSHADPWRMPRAALLADFARACAALEDPTGRPVRDVRPPYGHLTPALARWCRAGGRRIVLWDLMPGDFVASATPEAVALRIVRRARPGSVVVLHEGGMVGPVARAALDRTLPDLRARGWRFVAL